MPSTRTELYEVVWPGVPPGEYEPCAPVPPGLYYRTEEGLTCIEYDPEKSVELLDASGWVDSDGDGIRDKDGVVLSLKHCTTGAGYRVAAGDYLASQFRDLGVELINTAAPETIFAGWNEAGPDAECNLTRANFDTTEFAWVSSFNLFGNTYTVYHSDWIPSEENGGAGANFTRLNDPTAWTRRWTTCSAPPTRPRPWASPTPSRLSSPSFSPRWCCTTGATSGA